MLLFARFIQQFHCDKRSSPSDDSLGTVVMMDFSLLSPVVKSWIIIVDV